MKILSNRKGQIGKKIEVVVIIIISIVVLFQIFAGIVPEAQSAGETMSDEAVCNNAGCFFNETTETGSELLGCRINSSIEGNATACNVALQNIPLSGLFSSSGIVILLLMVFLFLGALRIVMPKSKK